MMRLRLVFLTVFVILACIASINGPKPKGSADVGLCSGAVQGAVQPDVTQALATQPDVPVFISLKTQEGANIADITSTTAEQQAHILAGLAGSGFVLTKQYDVVPALVGRMTQAAAAILNCHPDVLSVNIDGGLHAALFVSGPFIHAPEVNAQGFDGTGTKVAVLDTGIDSDNADVGGSNNVLGEQCDVAFYMYHCPDDPACTGQFCSPGHAAEDFNGHGTHVSGIITSEGVTPGVPKGIAPGAQIFAYKVAADDGSSDPSWISTALNDILRNQPAGYFNFINMSLQDGRLHQASECDTNGTYYPAINTTIRDLRSRGTLAFVSAGNSPRDASGVLQSGLSWPACVPYAVSVGAVFDASVGLPADYAQPDNAGCPDASPTSPDTVPCFSQSADFLDLLAPGAFIQSTWWDGSVHSLYGTSQASPHAVGVAALIKQALPGLTPDQIVARIKLGKPVFDQRFGVDGRRVTPRIDARAAILELHPNDDFDGDGCTNAQELGPNHMLGGQRNPLNPYDFPDMPPKDGKIDLYDVLYVINRYRHGEPGQSNTPPYDPAADHTILGPDNWNLGPPNGQIRIDDVVAVINSYRDHCR